MRHLFFLHLPEMKQIMQAIQYNLEFFIHDWKRFNYFLCWIQIEATLWSSLNGGYWHGSCANNAPHDLLIDTVSVLHCTDTFHLRDSASLLLYLSVSLFCLVLSVFFFIRLLFALSLRFPVVCALVMPPSVRCHAAAWQRSAKHGRHSLLQGDLVKIGSES